MINPAAFSEAAGFLPNEHSFGEVLT